MRTEDLIAALTRDVAPVRRLARPGVLALCWLAIAAAVLACAAAAFWHGPMARIGTGIDLLQMGLAGLTGVLAAIAACQLSFPDRDRRWLLLPLPSFGLWLAHLGWDCARDMARQGPDGLHVTMSTPCFVFIAGFGLPLALAMAWLARHAAALRPAPVAALAGLAAASLANVGLTLVDAPHAVGMELTWHGLAIVVTTIAATWLGPRVMRAAG
ncbi:MAG TPA: NrsF family protein [Roseomonas sp.]|jgi:hypothetical protein